MSVRMMTLVWELDLPDSEKLVLLALADCANDEGFCWPSVETLAKKCSKSERTVQGCIRTLCVKGHLTQRQKPGKSCDYTVHPIVRLADPRTGCTPAAAAPRDDCASPPQPLRQTPAAAAPKPLVNHKEPSTRARKRAAAVEIPDWMPPDAWAAFRKMRKAMRVPFTDDAERGIIGDLAKLKADGHDLEKVLLKAVKRGWRGVFGDDDTKAKADKVELTAQELRERAEWFIRHGQPDRADECRRKAIEKERYAA